MKRALKIGIAVLLGLTSNCELGGDDGSFDAVTALPPARFDDLMHVRIMSNTSAAVQALRLFDEVGSRDESPGCPRRHNEGDTHTVEGGCTTETGETYTGRLVMRGPQRTSPTTLANGEYTIDTENYGSRGTTRCTNGSSAEFRITYEIRLRMTVRDGHMEFTRREVQRRVLPDPETCVLSTLVDGQDYRGSVTIEAPADPSMPGFGLPGRVSAEGSGRFGYAQVGYFTSTTPHQVFDTSQCQLQAASGSTTLTAGAHTAVLTYDGATTCDAETAVPWTIDGVAQAPLTGIQCSVGATPGARGARSGALALGALALAYLFARGQRKNS